MNRVWRLVMGLPPLVAAAIAVPTVALGAGIYYVRKHRPVVVTGALARASKSAAPLPPRAATRPAGPQQKSWIGRVIDGKTRDEGWAKRLDPSGRGRYRLEWRQYSIWITSRPNDGTQYRKRGALRAVEIRAIAPSWDVAKKWGEVMAGVYAQRVWQALPQTQRYVVAPWPPAGVPGFKCTTAPGTNAIKNLACGRTRKQRDDIPIGVYKSAMHDGWYVARWPWGPLAAGTDLDQVIAEGFQAAERVNRQGKLTP